MPDQKLNTRQVRWARRWMTMVVVGLIIFILGINPDLIGMDRSPVVGFVQIGVWLFGLALILIGATLTVRVVRNGRPTSLRSEIGLRLIATGYVFAATSSFADFLGIGSHFHPAIYFGPVQALGLALGVTLSLAGVILYWPMPGEARPTQETRPRSSSTAQHSA